MMLFAKLNLNCNFLSVDITSSKGMLNVNGNKIDYCYKLIPTYISHILICRVPTAHKISNTLETFN